MGIFDRFKKKEKTKPQPRSTTDNESEFDRDLRILLDREDIKGRTDICNAEYQKAKDLLDEQTRESVHRAYDIMGNLASRFEFIPAILWMGDFAENVLQDMKQAAFWYKKAAELGDGNGARCFADMLMTGRGVNRNPQLALQFYADAADKGVAEAAFVLGEFFRKSGDRATALVAYQRAYSGGYEPAKIRIDQLLGK